MMFAAMCNSGKIIVFKLQSCQKVMTIFNLYTEYIVIIKQHFHHILASNKVD